MITSTFFLGSCVWIQDGASVLVFGLGSSAWISTWDRGRWRMMVRGRWGSGNKDGRKKREENGFRNKRKKKKIEKVKEKKMLND